MAIQAHRETATIIPFPRDGSMRNHNAVLLQRAELEARVMPRVDTGAWYHDDAIGESKQPSSH